MSPVDGISHPKSKKAKSKKIRKVKKSVSKVKPIPTEKISFDIKNEHKYKLVWLVSIGIVIIIFIGWLSIFQGLELSTTNNSTLLSRISNNFNELWDSLKKDILQINNKMPVENTNEAEQQLKELQEKVFPEFTESN